VLYYRLAVPGLLIIEPRFFFDGSLATPEFNIRQKGVQSRISTVRSPNEVKVTISLAS
jgi:hypothetical protein